MLLVHKGLEGCFKPRSLDPDFGVSGALIVLKMMSEMSRWLHLPVETFSREVKNGKSRNLGHWADHPLWAICHNLVRLTISLINLVRSTNLDYGSLGSLNMLIGLHANI